MFFVEKAHFPRQRKGRRNITKFACLWCQYEKLWKMVKATNQSKSKAQKHIYEKLVFTLYAVSYCANLFVSVNGWSGVYAVDDCTDDLRARWAACSSR